MDFFIFMQIFIRGSVQYRVIAFYFKLFFPNDFKQLRLICEQASLRFWTLFHKALVAYV